jgi:hypothetical protein
MPAHELQRCQLRKTDCPIALVVIAPVAIAPVAATPMAIALSPDNK